jgi:hypothetical protein
MAWVLKNCIVVKSELKARNADAISCAATNGNLNGVSAIDIFSKESFHRVDPDMFFR